MVIKCKIGWVRGCVRVGRTFLGIWNVFTVIDCMIKWVDRVCWGLYGRVCCRVCLL